MTSVRALTDVYQAHLVETGAKKLTQLYTKLVAEASTGVSPPPGTDVTANLFPEDILTSLNPLVRFLRTLPLPATHPSHPAAKTIMSTLKEAQKGYAEMRGAWARKCLESEAKRVLDRADTIDSLNAGKEFGYWVQSLLSVAEVRSRRRQPRQLIGIAKPLLLAGRVRLSRGPRTADSARPYRICLQHPA